MRRRDFLKLSALAAGAVTFGGAAHAGLVSRTHRAKRVVIVGAGLSGLAAALELRQRGHEVTVLEARMRPGGRVETIRDPFADGMFVEAGASRIPDNHDLTLGYAKRFGLDLVPFYPTSGRFVNYFRGRRFPYEAGSMPDYSALQLDIAEASEGAGTLGFVAERLGPVMSRIGDFRDPAWPNPDILRFDTLSIPAFIRERGLTMDTFDVLFLGLGNRASAEHISALWLIRELAAEFGETTKLKIDGGNDRLPAALARELAADIHYGAAAVRIAQDERGVRAAVESGGRRFEVDGDALLCTVPFPVLGRIDVDPAFSERKRRAVSELAYDSVTRTAVQFSDRFWEADGANGFGMSDAPTEIWHPTWDRPGARGLLLSYMRGATARRASALDEPERHRLVLSQIEAVHPGGAARAEGFVTKAWHDDPWAGGAYMLASPGQFEALMPYAATPEGRIYFAGEHISPWPGWMQGALASGLAAAEAIHSS